MIPGRIDVHAHLIPGVDDGCATIEQSLACARTLVEAGYTHAFCTPHVWPLFPQNVAANIREWTVSLQRSLEAAAIPLRLSPGGEINLGSNWPAIRELPRDEIVSYGLLGQHVLFDLWAETTPDYLIPGVRYLLSRDFVPIMAHPERATFVQRDLSILDELAAMGVLFQCNAYCLADPPGSPTRQVSERLLREGRYFLIGTDTHAPLMGSRLAGIRRARELVGETVLDELTITNPRSLMIRGS